MSSPSQPDHAVRQVIALTVALFVSYLAVAMSLPTVPIQVVHSLHLGNGYGGLAVGMHFLRPF